MIRYFIRSIQKRYHKTLKEIFKLIIFRLSIVYSYNIIQFTIKFDT